MSAGYLEPVVATATFDVAPFLENAKRAVGATTELSGSLDKAGIAAARAEQAVNQAALRAAAAQDKAAAAAARAAKAQQDAAAAAEKAAAGEISQAEAADKAATAQDLAAKAAQAEAKAALAARDAILAEATANTRLAETSKIAADSQKAAADASVGLAAKTSAAGVALAGSAGVAGKAASTLKDNWVLAAGIIGFESVKLAGTFEQQTNVLVTAAGESASNLKTIRDGILGIAEQTGTSWQQVTSAVYVAEKAGYRGADALNLVKASAQGAREEGANLATVLNATTSVLASYGLKASDAVRVTNEIKTAAGESKTTMEQFAGALSTVLPIASANHISFADVAGALATLTQHGTTADEATQELANTIRNLSGSNKVASKELAQFGISSVDVSQQLGTRGLTGTIDYLTQAILGKLGPSGQVLLNTFNQSKIAASDAQQEFDALPPSVQKLAQSFENGQTSAYAYRKELRNIGGEASVLGTQWLTTYTNAQGFQQALKDGTPVAQSYTQALKTIFGGATGLNTALQLTGSQLAATNERTQKIAASAKGAGKDVSGWASTQKLFNVQLDEFKQRLAAAGIHLGEDLIPPLKTTLGLLDAHPAILQAVAAGLGLMIVRWGALKALGLVQWIGGLGSKLLGLAKAEDVAAASTRGLADAEGAAGIAGAAEGAGGTAARGGLLAGLLGGEATIAPLAAGVAGIAYGIHQIVTDGQVKNLPALNALSKAIASGGLSGKPGTQAISDALASTGTGNNRGENLQDYLTRILGNKSAVSKVQAQYPGSGIDLSVAGLLKTIQTGNKGQIASFISQLHDLEFALKGSPDTINKVDTYLQALWSRYNSARVAADQLTKAQKEQQQANFASAVAANLLSTNVDALSKTYGVNHTAAQELATDNKNYALDVKGTVQAMTGYGVTLDKNSYYGRQNIQQVQTQIELAKLQGAQVLKLTGSQTLANAATRSATIAFENAATAAGFNKQQVDALARSFGGLPTDPTITLHVNGVDAANAALYGLEKQLQALAQPIIIPIETQSNLLGVASNTYVPTLPQILGAQGHASGGLLRGPGSGTSDSIPIMASNGEFIVNAEAAKKHHALLAAINGGYAAGGIVGYAKGGAVETPEQKALKYIASHKTVAAYLQAVNARNSLADNPGAFGLLRDLVILGGYTHAQNQILGFNKANFSKATAAQVPGLQLAAQNAAAVASAVGGYFNKRKATLWEDAHSGSAAQRKAAGSLYNELANFAHLTQSDALQEASLATKLRARYAGLEYNPVSFGRPSRDLSYLSFAGAPTVAGPSHINMTVISQLDGREVGRSVSTFQLRKERLGLTSGATAVRNPSPAGSR